MLLLLCASIARAKIIGRKHFKLVARNYVVTFCDMVLLSLPPSESVCGVLQIYSFVQKKRGETGR